MVSRQVSLQAYEATGANGQAGNAIIGNTVVQIDPVQVAPGTSTVSTLPQSLPAKVSLDGGTSWAAFQLPSNITTNFTVPGTDITVTGGCVQATAICTYQLTGSFSITAKPWGTATKPDCSGFTLDQFTALDMGKMDLSQWVASVSGQMNQSSTQMAAQAQAQAQSGPTNAPVQQQPQGVVVSPTEGLGPFPVTVTVAGNWPENYADPALNKDPVYSVDINWGDCSIPSTAMPVPTGGFAEQHMYQAPNTPGICDENGPVSTPGNLIHKLVITVNSASGPHQVVFQIKNDFNNYTSGN